VSGVLELHPQGYGFLRQLSMGLKSTASDPYVPPDLIAQYQLRQGALVDGEGRTESRGKRAVQGLACVAKVEGVPVAEFRCPPRFEDRRPILPESRLRLETGPAPLSTRIMDLFTPIGRGQRALIVAPPKSGKTVLLREIGQAVAANHTGVEVCVLLIDERPEEVTEMRDRVPGNVFASSLDCPVESHVRLARLVVDRCRRMTECGRDVLLLVDSLTRIARSFNKTIRQPGPLVAGGLHIRALDEPKQLFAAARAFAGGGSLTIVATALVETNNRMDEVIFQEFKGTGNMELVLHQQLAERRVWPAIDLHASSTRNEDRLVGRRELAAAIAMRRNFARSGPVETMATLTDRLSRFSSNRELIDIIQPR
jgi:transcription termination factor Rho